MISYAPGDWHHPDIVRLSGIISGYTDASGVIGVRMVSAEHMRELNREYAGKDEETDVLSFNYTEYGERNTGNSNSDSDLRLSASDSLPPISELGDIAISRPRAAAQAEQAGTNEDTERLLLLAHGTLHVLGFDHRTSGEQRRMDQMQRDIMQQLGHSYRQFGWHD